MIGPCQEKERSPGVPDPNRCPRRARREQPEAVREALVPALLAGAASHHAGALPGWKSLVEGLFQRGLLKVPPWSAMRRCMYLLVLRLPCTIFQALLCSLLQPSPTQAAGTASADLALAFPGYMLDTADRHCSNCKP